MVFLVFCVLIMFELILFVNYVYKVVIFKFFSLWGWLVI